MLLRNTINGDNLYGLIRTRRIAVGGHSFGGLTAIQLTGGDDLVCDTYAQANPPQATCVPFLDVDTRVKAMVLLDPSTQNMKYHELARVRTKTILIGEDMASVQRGIERGDLPPVPLVLNARAHHAFAWSGKPNYRVDVLNSIHTASLTNACQVMLVRGDIGLLTPAEVQAQLARLRCEEAEYIPYHEANELVWRYAVSFLTWHLAGDKTYTKVLTEKWAVRCEPFAMFFKDEPTDGQMPSTEFPDASWFHTSQPDQPNDWRRCEGGAGEEHEDQDESDQDE
jgi:hypothetical protein